MTTMSAADLAGASRPDSAFKILAGHVPRLRLRRHLFITGRARRPNPVAGRVWLRP